MIPIPNQGAFTAANISAIMANLQSVIGVTGNVYFVDPVGGNNNNNGQFPSNQGGGQGAVATLAAGESLLASGNNDVLVLISNGAAASSARLSSGFTWAKNAAHLVGMCSPALLSQRARIAPTAAVTAFANFFTVSGNGCYFRNIQFFQGFDTGVAAEIALTVSGGRNVFDGCHIAGMGDTVGGHDAGSRNLKLSGTGENVFRKCTIGIDTIVRDVANASIEFSGGTPRNYFEDCVFPILATAATVLGIKVAAAAGSDRFQLFKGCTFINAIQSTGVAMTGLATLAASMGGMLVFRDCQLVGVTSMGTDATSKGQIYEYGPANSTSAFLSNNPA